MRDKPAVLRFIDEERGKGTSDKVIQHKLLDAGWHIDIVHHALDKKHGGRPTAVNPATPVEPLFQSEIKYGLISLGAFLVLVIIALFV